MKARKGIIIVGTCLLFLVALGSLSPCLAKTTPLEGDKGTMIDIISESVVSDDIGGTTVVPTVQIQILPMVLDASGKGIVIGIIVSPPESYGPDDIIPESVVISDIGGNSVNIQSVWYHVIHNDMDDDDNNGDVKELCDNYPPYPPHDEGEMLLLYGRSDILSVVNEHSLTGYVKVTVQGMLDDGNSFTGSGTISVVNVQPSLKGKKR